MRYAVTRELGFFNDHDELYWNVTGNGWVYQIDTAEATVHLPASVPLSRVTSDAFTGPYGSQEKQYTVSTTTGGISFLTTSGLGENSGLTIVVGWPKGYVTPPSSLDVVLAFIIGNWITLLCLIFIVGLFISYCITWWKQGRDPKAGIIIAQYEAPLGLSPATTRYLYKEGYDNKALVASLIHLAVQKNIRIEETSHLLKTSTYKLIRLNGETTCEDEELVLDTILPAGTLAYEPSQSHYEPLKKAIHKQKVFFKGSLQNLMHQL
jgi:hypothetical protein